MKAYFFDLDGTLTDSREGLFKCFRAALDALGIGGLDDAGLGAFLGAPLPRMLRALDPTVTQERIELGIQAFRREYERSGVPANRLYGGVDEMLYAIAQTGAQRWLVTSKPQPYAEQVAKYLGIATRLNGIIGAGLDETDTKTSLLSKALDLSRASPANAIMLGDRADDVIAALENKMMPVGVRWGYAAEGELEGAGCTEFVYGIYEFVERYVHAQQATVRQRLSAG